MVWNQSTGRVLNQASWTSTTLLGSSTLGMGASTDTTPKEAVAAGWAEALEEGHLAGPNLLGHAWPFRSPSLTNNP